MSKCYDNPEYDDTYSDIQNTWNQHPKVEQEHETKVMKNLHILQTDKPSRLACDFDKLILNSRLLSPILYKTQNIYITSDEEIKEGDWFYLDDAIIVAKYIDVKPDKEAQKIILTTNQDLIKDGVQAIDDEFLEWFVKNPSCEEVEIDKAEHGTYKDDVYYKLSNKIFYKIIIPREEQTKCYCGHTTYCDCGPEEPKQDKIMERFIANAKQETLEEVAEISDKEMLDWLEKIMIKGDNYCEVYFAGLRHGANDATEFQIESNPEKFKVIKGKNIREIIKKAIKNYEKYI